MKSFFKKIIVGIITIEARLVLFKYKPRIVAVTGSVGKTSTKDALAAVLATSFFTRKSTKSFNSEIGVPLTILGRTESGWSSVRAWLAIITEGIALIVFRNHYPRVLVVEVGADHPGDIKRITRWLKPETVVITRFGKTPVHMEFFNSREALLEEKAALADAVQPGGTLILGADDEDVRALASRAPQAKRVIRYGFSEQADVRGVDEHVAYGTTAAPSGMSARVKLDGKVQPLVLHGVLGKQPLYAALAGIAAAKAYGIEISKAAHSLSELSFPPGRMRILDGVHSATIIDDSYNASPAAVEAALETLSTIECTGRRIAVLGDMLELGSETATAHEEVGTLVPEYADILVTVGVRALAISNSAHEAGMKKKQMRHFDNAHAASEFVGTLVKKGDIVLVKGSQSVRMEHIVKRLLSEQERAADLLVRQGPEWEKR